jgi:hypothetical protein
MRKRMMLQRRIVEQNNGMETPWIDFFEEGLKQQLISK